MARRVSKIDHTQVERDKASHTSGGKFHKFQEGANYVRILPPLEDLVDEGTYYGLHHQHGIKMEGAFRSIKCLQDVDSWCPFCAMAEYFIKLQGADNKKRAQGCFSSAKYFLNAISAELRVGKDKKRNIVPSEDSGITILQISGALFKKCDKHMHGEWGDFTDENDGYWLNINAEGDGTSRRYPQVTPSRLKTGPLPDWVDYDDAYDLTAADLIPLKKTSEMVAILVDRFGDVVDVEDILRNTRKRKKG